MSFEGMDIDQVRDLTTQISADAQTLSGLVSTMTDIIAQLTIFWQGPVVAVFEQDWQTRYRPSLLAACDTLTALHAHLVSNISQQTSASAADGGWTTERVVGDLENILKAEGLVSLLLPGSALLEGTRVGAVFTGLDTISLGLDAYHTDDDEFRGDEALVQGHYVEAANDFTIGVGDGLQTSGDLVGSLPVPGAKLYAIALDLAGVDVKLADQVANLDWKDTPNPLSGSNFRQYYLPEFESMGTGAYWKQAGQVIWGDM